jgi:predicted dehydrogenase
VRTAVVGLGYWGPNIARNLHELDVAALQLLCDRRPDVLEAVAARYPGVRTTTSFEDVLSNDEIEAVLIATPVGTHFELVEAALQSGRHVFVEKPLAASAVEAERLAALAEAKRLTLMPGHTFLYSPPVNLIRDFIRGGDLGEIYFVSSSRVNLGIHQSDVSVVWDLAPHDFSILRYWFDETPVSVSGLSRSCVFPGVADVAFINLRYASGIVAHVELSWLAPSKLRRTAIVGSEKMIVYDDTSPEPVRLFDAGVSLPDPQSFGEYRLSYRTGDILAPRVDPVEPLALELRDFCASVRAGTEPRSSARIGCDVVRLIEAVDVALAGDVVAVDGR